MPVCPLPVGPQPTEDFQVLNHKGTSISSSRPRGPQQGPNRALHHALVSSLLAPPGDSAATPQEHHTTPWVTSWEMSQEATLHCWPPHKAQNGGREVSGG